jgi:hypothetical protein
MLSCMGPQVIEPSRQGFLPAVGVHQPGDRIPRQDLADPGDRETRHRLREDRPWISRGCEQELVILPAAQDEIQDVPTDQPGHRRRSWVNGKLTCQDASSHPALRTEVSDVRGDSVADIQHGCGTADQGLSRRESRDRRQMRRHG